MDFKIITFKQKSADGYYAKLAAKSFYEDFYKGRKIMLQGRRFKVVTVLSQDGLVYELELSRKNYDTSINYDEIDFGQVMEIARTSELTISIYFANNFEAQFIFDDAEKCLHEYLMLQLISKEERSYGEN